MMDNYQERLKKEIIEIMGVDSPTGFTQAVSKVLTNQLAEMGYQYTVGNLGNIIVTVDGRDNSKTVGFSAHLDTLGLMVRSITPEGELRFVPVGSPLVPSLDGEYCKIYTRDGRVYTGTILSLSPSKHTFKDATDRLRVPEEMSIRIDEEVDCAEDVRALGIAVGDFICYDPKTVITESGFLKSRFIDDKACVCLEMVLLKYLKDKQVKPKYKTHFCFSVHEEIGYGGATLPKDLDELLVVDMGCVGLDLSCNDRQVSICAKDSLGPYDYEMTTRLVEICRERNIDAVTDIYPMYGSDAGALWRAGYDTRCALVGPGVSASHGMERTHMKALMGTLELMGADIDVM